MVCPECGLKLSTVEELEIAFFVEADGRRVRVRVYCPECKIRWEGTIRQIRRKPGSGRMKTTGKFKTREELVRNVVELVDVLGLKFHIAARKCGVSDTTARKIYDEHWRTVTGLSSPIGCSKCQRVHGPEVGCENY